MDTMSKRRVFGVLLSLLLAFGTMLQMTIPTFAEGTAKEVDVTITDFKITDSKGQTLTETTWNSSFFLNMKWKIKNQNEIVHKGDYFDIKLPDNMRFIEAYTTFDFPLTDDNGETIANAHVTPGPDNSGGTVRVTFNDKIENKEVQHES